MAITEQEAEKIELRFLEAEEDYGSYSTETARKVIAAWNNLVQIMARENNMTDCLGSNILDWQVMNWANDTAMIAHNAHLYDEEIRVNEQILKIKWSGNNNLMHENAKRDIADSYADKGDVEKCYQLYEEYLREDPLWGWAWIGYYRQIHDHDNDRFETTLEDLYQKIKAGVDFRDKEDLYWELAEEYETLGNKERADYFNGLLDAEKEKSRPSYGCHEQLIPVVKPTKIHPNDPCPCGSGKKYKKCCGKR